MTRINFVGVGPGGGLPAIVGFFLPPAGRIWQVERERAWPIPNSPGSFLFAHRQFLQMLLALGVNINFGDRASWLLAGEEGRKRDAVSHECLAGVSSS